MEKGFTNTKKTLSEILRELFLSFSENEKYYAELGIVISVNLGEATAEIELLGGATLPDVRLQQIKTGTGLIIEPVTGSPVIINYTDNTTAYIAMYSEIGNIIFQDGANGGLIKITDLTSKLNQLKNEVTAELALISTAIGSLGGAYAPGILSAFAKGDYENEKFSH